MATTMNDSKEQLPPPGPWRWHPVNHEASAHLTGPPNPAPEGQILLAADGTRLIWGESAASPLVHPAVKDLLADAWALSVRLERVEETADRLGEQVNELRLELSNRELQVGRLIEERDQARAWARGLEHRMLGSKIDPDEPPEWLTAPLTFEE